jgi:hypothetical protein
MLELLNYILIYFLIILKYLILIYNNKKSKKFN